MRRDIDEALQGWPYDPEPGEVVETGDRAVEGACFAEGPDVQLVDDEILQRRGLEAVVGPREPRVVDEPAGAPQSPRLPAGGWIGERVLLAEQELVVVAGLRFDLGDVDAVTRRIHRVLGAGDAQADLFGPRRPAAHPPATVTDRLGAQAFFPGEDHARQRRLERVSGRVAWISIAPVKGLALIAREAVELTVGGVVEDRRFFLVDERATMLNGKRLGPLATVRPTVADEALTLDFPDGSRVTGAIATGERTQVRSPARSAAP